jgi:hypothetical protein
VCCWFPEKRGGRLAAVEAGGALHLIARAGGAVELDQLHRFRVDGEADASLTLCDGDDNRSALPRHQDALCRRRARDPASGPGHARAACGASKKSARPVAPLIPYATVLARAERLRRTSDRPAARPVVAGGFSSPAALGASEAAPVRRSRRSSKRSQPLRSGQGR